VPQVDGDPNLGYTVFQENCAACHGEQGEGRIGATLATAFAAVEPGAFTIETIKRGVSGSMMPPFGQEHGGPLSDEEINNVAAYVLSIQQPSRVPTGEVVQRGSGWPLLIVFVISVIVIVALGVTLERRQQPKE
jgi:mono/diheme cytochrome c family protein